MSLTIPFQHDKTDASEELWLQQLETSRPRGSPIENIRRKAMASTTHTDPVCRMQVTEDNAKATAEQNGQTFYFCSQQCADKFNRDPQQYIQAA